MLYYDRTISWDIPRGRNASTSGKCGNIRGAFRKVSCIRRHGSPCVPNHRATGKKEKERIITMIMNPTAIKHVVVDGHSLTLESFVAISRYNATVDLLGNNGGHALVEHLEQHLHEDGTNAAHAAAQSVGTQQHHAADDLVSIRLAGGGAVAEDQVGGELVAHLLGERPGPSRSHDAPHARQGRGHVRGREDARR